MPFHIEAENIHFNLQHKSTTVLHKFFIHFQTCVEQQFAPLLEHLLKALARDKLNHVLNSKLISNYSTAIRKLRK